MARSAVRALMSRWVRGRGDAELRDNSRLLVSELESNSVRHAGGFGLQLVESIATRWGVSHARGTRVWFELPVGGHPA
jgi:hypothetical protein